MQPFQGTALFRVTLFFCAILGLYAMNYLIVPGGLPIPGFQQWWFPSLLGSSTQQLPTSMNVNPILIASPDATNSTTLLLPDTKSTQPKDHEVVMNSASTSDSKDLEQSFLTKWFPGATDVSNNTREELEDEKRGSSRKEGPILQGDGDPRPGAIQDDEGEEQNVSTTFSDDLGFGVENSNAWLGLEERMRNNNTFSKSHSSGALQGEEKELKGGGGLEGGEKNGTAGAEILSSSAPPPPPLSPKESFEGGNVPWLAEVATLLSKCASTAPIKILEHLANKPCPRNCSANGICNYELATCRCFHGYTGSACDLDKDFECNMKYSSDVVDQGPFGPWILSMCPAQCDKRKAFCYCGEGTKYPKRPAAEQCGFLKIVGPVSTYVNWTVSDMSIFTEDNSKLGWCNVDPAEYYAGWAQKKDNCFCIYDGTVGDLCEFHSQSTCVNQCSGNGFCRNGFCACEEGWYGIDCSIPAVTASMKSWPSWLSSDTADNQNHPPSKVGHQGSIKISVERRRPLIYVYDLPAQFNSLLLEGRHFKFHCVNRVYDAKNWTVWVEALYGAENAFLESLLASKHRTNNAEEADFFYVPVLGACAIARSGNSPHMDIQRKHRGIRPYFAGDVYYKKAYQHIRENYPYWDRYKGRDHIWMFPWDEGACVSPKEIWSSMMLVHWGNTNSKYNYSTTAYGPDDWSLVPKYWRGNHPCYDPEKDLVLPSWKEPSFYNQRRWTRKIDERPTLFYFRGNLGSKYKNGRPELRYSMGIRQRVADEFGTEPNLEGQVGRQAAPDVKVFHGHSDHYSLEMASSRFCGVFPGDGWSSRLEDSILHGCIPVIIQDGIDLPFENVLDYSKFSVRIAEEHLPLMLDILRSIPEEDVNKMQSRVQNLWQRFTYQNSVRLEADRQTASGKSWVRSWASEVKNLSNHDTFDTFIQVLHYKLLQRESETTSKHIQNDPSVNCYDYSYDLKMED